MCYRVQGYIFVLRFRADVLWDPGLYWQICYRVQGYICTFFIGFTDIFARLN
jgi:hypothetical protein